MAVQFNGGVIIGADSRTSSGYDFFTLVETTIKVCCSAVHSMCKMIVSAVSLVCENDVLYVLCICCVYVISGRMWQIVSLTS